MNLQEIGQKHNTDKADEVHTAHGRSLLQIYEKIFESFRNENFTLIEIGVRNGQSLKTWEEYFPNAKIIGIDIDPNAKKHESSRAKVITSDQKDPSLLELITDKPRVILDDGSHVNDLTIATYKLLWPLLQSGGFYILEDMHCTYFDINPFLGSWDGMNLNSNSSDINYNNLETRPKLNDMFLRTIKEMDSFGPMPTKERTGDVKSLCFYPMTVIFEKA